MKNLIVLVKSWDH